jgi:hypothetical protein
MRCAMCGKKLDHVDCECGWCTFCGTIFDALSFARAEKKE